jgi:hypothetical protein
MPQFTNSNNIRRFTQCNPNRTCGCNNMCSCNNICKPTLCNSNRICRRITPTCFNGNRNTLCNCDQRRNFNNFCIFGNNTICDDECRNMCIGRKDYMLCFRDCVAHCDQQRSFNDPSSIVGLDQQCVARCENMCGRGPFRLQCVLDCIEANNC